MSRESSCVTCPHFDGDFQSFPCKVCLTDYKVFTDKDKNKKVSLENK